MMSHLFVQLIWRLVMKLGKSFMDRLFDGEPLVFPQPAVLEDVLSGDEEEQVLGEPTRVQKPADGGG